MNLPSVKTLSRLFPPGFSEDNAALAKMVRKLLENQYGGTMMEISGLMGCHGVESLGTCSNDYADYVNVGDPYVATLVCDENGRFTVEGYGDFIERKERAGIRFA